MFVFVYYFDFWKHLVFVMKDQDAAIYITFILGFYYDGN